MHIRSWSAAISSRNICSGSKPEPTPRGSISRAAAYSFVERGSAFEPEFDGGFREKDIARGGVGGHRGDHVAGPRPTGREYRRPSQAQTAPMQPAGHRGWRAGRRPMDARPGRLGNAWLADDAAACGSVMMRGDPQRAVHRPARLARRSSRLCRGRAQPDRRAAPAMGKTAEHCPSRTAKRAAVVPGSSSPGRS